MISHPLKSAFSYRLWFCWHCQMPVSIPKAFKLILSFTWLYWKPVRSRAFSHTRLPTKTLPKLRLSSQFSCSEFECWSVKLWTQMTALNHIFHFQLKTLWHFFFFFCETSIICLWKMQLRELQDVEYQCILRLLSRVC